MTHEKMKVAGFEAKEQRGQESEIVKEGQSFDCARLSAYLAGVLKPPDAADMHNL